MNIGKSTVLNWMREDLPYFDLTTHLLGIGEKPCKVAFYTRQDATLSGSEEVQTIFKEIGITDMDFKPSGTKIKANDVFFSVEGSFEAANKVCKVAQNIFEYASGIATRTALLTERAKAVNPAVNVLLTRKVFPGTKELSVKSVLVGGAYPHRLGLSDSILLFKQHIDFLGGFEALEEPIRLIKTKDSERKVIVEVDTPEEAFIIQSLAIDGIQYDKFQPDELRKTVATIRQNYPHLIHLAAGGINEHNVAEYAATDVNGLVTTSAYFGKPVDIGVRFTQK